MSEEKSIDFKIRGILKEVLPVQEIQGKKGVFVKQEAIIHIPGQYPKDVCILFKTDKSRADVAEIKTGEEVSCFCDVDCREYNGKYYTNVTCFSINKINGGGSSRPTPEPKPSAEKEFDESPFDDSEDVPF